jgi:dipeptidyl aminopeptidase/acylaminoacyl peptidase
MPHGWRHLPHPPVEGPVVEVALSSDGSLATALVGGSANAWLYPLKGGQEWRPVPLPAGASSISFSGDTLLGLAPQKKGQVVFACDPGRGEVRTLTPPMLSGGRPVWDAAGRTLAWCCARPGAVPPIRRTDRLGFDLDGRGWLNENVRQVHLWRDGGGEPVVLDSPTDCQDVAWGADGSSLVYVSARHDGRTHDFAAQVFSTGVGQETEAALTPATLVPCHPVPLGGGTVAFVALDGAAGAGCVGALYLAGPDGVTRLTEPDTCDLAHPLTARLHGLFAVGEHLISPRLARGAVSLIAWSRGGTLSLLDGPWQADALDATAAGVLALVRCGFDTEDLLFLPAEAIGDHEKAGPAPAPTSYGTRIPRPIAATAPDGETIDAWLVTPANQDRPVPLVVWLHGGPGAQAGWWIPPDAQRAVEAGLACLYLNPRGSAGRGRRFTGDLVGALGSIDVEDVLAVLATVADLPEIDRDRIGVHGVSYGGYLAAMLWSRSPLVKAAVMERAIASWEVHREISDLGLAFTDGYWGEAVTRPDPVGAVPGNAPILIIAGEHDARCPPAEARLLFTRLVERGARAEFAVLTGAGHNVAAALPQVRRARVEAINDWWARHLGAAR